LKRRYGGRRCRGEPRLISDSSRGRNVVIGCWCANSIELERWRPCFNRLWGRRRRNQFPRRRGWHCGSGPRYCRPTPGVRLEHRWLCALGYVCWRSPLRPRRDLVAHRHSPEHRQLRECSSYLGPRLFRRFDEPANQRVARGWIAYGLLPPRLHLLPRSATPVKFLPIQAIRGVDLEAKTALGCFDFSVSILPDGAMSSDVGNPNGHRASSQSGNRNECYRGCARVGKHGISPTTARIGRTPVRERHRLTLGPWSVVSRSPSTSP
jgi:hypothetical protein